MLRLGLSNRVRFLQEQILAKWNSAVHWTLPGFSRGFGNRYDEFTMQECSVIMQDVGDM